MSRNWWRGKEHRVLCVPSQPSLLLFPTSRPPSQFCPAPERLLGSDDCKPCSVLLVIIRSISQRRLEILRARLGAFGREAISSPELRFILLEGQVPHVLCLTYTCSCTNTPWLSVSFIARSKHGPWKGGFTFWTSSLFFPRRVFLPFCMCGSGCVFLCMAFTVLPRFPFHEFLLVSSLSSFPPRHLHTSPPSVAFSHLADYKKFRAFFEFFVVLIKEFCNSFYIKSRQMEFLFY